MLKSLESKRAFPLFQFGYHTGKGEHDNSFREEKRLPDGTVTGAYGYVDKDGRKHVVKYTAGKDGFKVEGDVDPNIAAASAAKLPSTTEAPAAAYQPPVSSYRQPIAQPQPQPQPAYQPPATTSAPLLSAYTRPEPASASAVPSEALKNFEEARAQVAANRYQAPISPSYQAPLSRQRDLGQNLAYRPPVRTAAAASAQPVGTHLATSATTARINSRAVRKLLQTR